MRPNQYQSFHNCSEFQSTHPLRDATIKLIALIKKGFFPYFNPRTPYGMRLPPKLLHHLQQLISIHAPLTGCDSILCYYLRLTKYFNPRTPYGMRPSSHLINLNNSLFQSTHPLRDATLNSSISDS